MVTVWTTVPVITTERELSYYDEHFRTGSCVWFVPQKSSMSHIVSLSTRNSPLPLQVTLIFIYTLLFPYPWDDNKRHVIHLHIPSHPPLTTIVMCLVYRSVWMTAYHADGTLWPFVSPLKFMVSGFFRGVNDIFTLLGCYAAYTGSYLSMFRVCTSVTSSSDV